MLQFVLRAWRGKGLILALGASALAAAESDIRWHLDSFRAFSEGHLPDGGVNLYAAADGTVRLINAFDFNQDGRPDIFFPSNHGYGEKVDLSIYWDRPGFDPAHVTRLPTDGGKDAAVADLNRDGWPDLVVVSEFDGTKTELNAFIYWGSPQGFSVERRTSLPTQGAQGVAIADLNADGWPEIVIANSGLTYHVAVDKFQQSFLYWSDHGRFDAGRRTSLPTINGRDVAIADLNADGAPDIVLVSAGNEPGAAGESGARIFWGRNGRFDSAHSLFLPGEGSSAVALGDLNRDGRPDLVLVNKQRLKGREAGIYDIVDTVQLDSFVYWNSAGGFSPEHRSGLPTVAGAAAAIGDLDQDGWPELIFANSQGDASFVYWGSAEGFLPRRRLALPTHNASAVIAADLKRAGHLDLVFANANLGRSFDTDSYIYWGGPHGPDAGRRQTLPTSGAAAIVVADLNRKDRNDLIFVNQRDGTGSETPGSLYLSNPKNPAVFSAAARIEVDTRGPDAYSAADLNLDGRPDFVIPGSDGLSIYWNGEKPFQRDTRTPVISNHAFSVRVADFNRDGYLDLLPSEWSPGATQTRLFYGGPGGFNPAATFAFPIGGIRFHTIADFNGDGWIDVAFPADQKVTIYWNGPSGFSAERHTDLPGRSAVALEVADFNADGYLDLIVPNLFDLNPPPENTTRAFGGSPKADVFVYWGSKQGYSAERRLVLPAIGAEDAAVADLNRDGRLDLVITSYHGGTRRDFPSYIYWQGPDGFDASHVTMLETYSASGALVTDFNGDGWPDILIANHHRNGAHRTNSFLYWGGTEGFSEKRRLELPSNGVHLMTVTDHGNVFDRSHDYRYVSFARQLASAKQLRALTWAADTPPGTSVRLQIRSASSRDALDQAAWEGSAGSNSYFDSPAEFARVALKGSWVQFRATLSNPGGGLPVLRSVTLDFD